MNLFEAVKQYKKSGSRNLKLWAAQVIKKLDASIKETVRELEELKDDLNQKIEERKVDLIDQLLNVDENSMMTVEARKDYAEAYLIGAKSSIDDYNEDVEVLKAEIAQSEAELASYTSLKASLSEIDLGDLVEETKED